MTRLKGKHLSDAIKSKTVAQNPSSTVPARHVGLREKKFPSWVGMRYLYQPCEVESGRRGATDPVGSLDVYWLCRSVTKPSESVLSFSPRGFVTEKLLEVSPDTQLPQDGVLRR